MTGPAPVVTLYGRPGCHLCDAAQAVLESLAGRLGFSLTVVNIEEDDELHQRYMFEIPVVSLGDEEIAKAPISDLTLAVELEERLGPR